MYEDRGVCKYIILWSTKGFRTLWSSMEMREGHYWPHRGSCLEAPYSFFSLCICRSTYVRAANWSSQQGALAGNWLATACRALSSSKLICSSAAAVSKSADLHARAPVCTGMKVKLQLHTFTNPSIISCGTGLSSPSAL